MQPASRGPTPLLGRDADLRLIGAALVEADKGVGSIVLISGEAGIGKTRLCAELSRSHRQSGGHVLLGRAVPEESSLPYAALADALRAARRAEPGVWEAARAQAEVLWAVAPELAAAGDSNRSVDRPVLFEALLDAVEEYAGDTTTLWVLDDIHWADDSTWEFVRYAARRVADLRVVLAITHREEEIGPGHPWWGALLRLKREPTVSSLPLARLTHADSELLIRAIDPSLPDDTVAEIAKRAAGTPLLVEELASLASSPGRLLPVPDIMRATVRERTEYLSPETRTLLEAAAVGGVEVDATLVTSIFPEGRLGDLVTAGLLLPEEENYRFRHPLLQEAVYDEVPAGRRRALHEQIAAAIGKTDGYTAERVSAHLERAGRPGAALSVLEAAADDAKRAGHAGRKANLQLVAFRLSQRYRSLAGRRAGLEQAVIEDMFSAGRWSELDPLLREAWAGRHVLSNAARAQLAAAFTQLLFWTGSIDQAFTVAKAELARLEERVAMDDAGPLLREAGHVAWFRGDGVAARNFVDRALEVARRTGDLELESRATRTEILVAYGETGDPQAAIDRLREYSAIAHARGLAIPEGWTRLLLSLFAGALHGVKEARQVSEQASAWFWLAGMHEATFHLLEGDIEQSEAIFGQIRQEHRLGVPTIAAWLDAKETWLYLHHGDLNAARKLLSEPSAASEASSTGLIGAEWSAARGWLAWEEDRLEDACAQLASACADTLLRTYNTIPPGPAFLALRVDAHLRLGQADQAARAISAVTAFNLSHGRFIAAALAAARFRLDPTPARAAKADTAAAAAPWPWLRALVACWSGEFRKDHRAAEDARRQFEALGAHKGVDRADAVLRHLGVKVQRHEHGTGALTSREREIAELIAEGMSNPAIARRLYLSRPTVASHVTHILAKLGFSSRAQIAAWAAQQRSPAR